MVSKNLLISFSGGETSALMTYYIKNGSMCKEYDNIAVVFANTGQERNETLDFVDKCDRRFGFGVVWVEAFVHHNRRKSSSCRIVDYNSAARIGSEMGPFENVIRKYGITNSKFKHCTRELKQNPIRSYAKDHLGWGSDTYHTAIGIRSDEIDRISPKKIENRLLYPLIDRIPTNKEMVNDWWRKQPFRLDLKGYEGNCAWCWKKSNRKLYTIMRENPQFFDFPRRMERDYSKIGPEFPKVSDEYRRVFFRGNKSVRDLEAENLRMGSSFTPASDDHISYEQYDPRLDAGGGCEDSCEVFGDDDDDEF